MKTKIKRSANNRKYLEREREREREKTDWSAEECSSIKFRFSDTEETTSSPLQIKSNVYIATTLLAEFRAR